LTRPEMQVPRVLAATAAALALWAAPAAAATVVGNADAPVAASSTFSQFTWTISPSAISTIPADGVITSWRAWLAGDGSGSLVVLRPGTAGSYEIAQMATGTFSGAAGVKTFPARLPVRANDVIAIDAGDLTQVGMASAPATRGLVLSGNPTVGTTMTAGDYQTAAGYLPVVEATVEPDADRDGFGDESQDACDSDPLASTPPCATDLTATLAGADEAVPPGGLAAYVATVSNVGPETATGARVELTLPAGVEPVLASRACTGAPLLVCPVGDLAPGAQAETTLVVRTRASGDVELAARARHDGRELADANDLATAPLRLLRTPNATQPGPRTTTATPLPGLAPIGPLTQQPRGGAHASVIRLCRVPNLRRHSAAAARRLLTKAGCRAGRVQGNRRGRVVRQSLPARTRVVAGTKVGITLSRG
jgi:uncharacterized repeat protein (TIGR01451 family)